MDGGEHARQVGRSVLVFNCTKLSLGIRNSIVNLCLLFRFATLSVEDGDKGGGGEGGKRQKRGGKGMVKVKKKESDNVEKKIQGLIRPQNLVPCV